MGPVLSLAVKAIRDVAHVDYVLIVFIQVSPPWTLCGRGQRKPWRQSVSRSSLVSASLPHTKVPFPFFLFFFFSPPFFFLVSRGWKRYWIQEFIVVLCAAGDEGDRFMKWTISNGIIFPQWGIPFINHARVLRKQNICYSCTTLYLHPPESSWKKKFPDFLSWFGKGN